MQEYIKRLEAAQNHLDNAVTPEEIDMAIHEMNMAELAIDKFIKESKEDQKNEKAGRDKAESKPKGLADRIRWRKRRG